MPANVSALVKKAVAGTELACWAHEKDFSKNDRVVRCGVISYYAAATLAGANDLSSWFAAIERMSQADLTTGVITPFYQPNLQVIGNAHLPLPGRAQTNPA